MIVLIDNYDSFTYNLYQYLGEVADDIKVIRNDELSVAEIAALKPRGIVLSPGPGHPREAGVCMEVVEKLHSSVSILGICLGHQAIVEAFGGTVSYAPRIMHGKTSAIEHSESALFENIPQKTSVMRYHSLAAIEGTLPTQLQIIARAMDDEVVMSVQHVDTPTYGIQFHPESFLTEDGKQMLLNWVAQLPKEVEVS
ncbi:MAG: anthranilate synthase component II [Bacilli bacterium]